jgi:hypothetical protein
VVGPLLAARALPLPGVLQGRAASTSAKFYTASYLTKDTSRRNLWLRIDVCVGIVVLRNS